MSKQSTVYLLHFSAPYRWASHYLGSTEDLDERLTRHREGNGARLVEVITQAGISFECVRTWPGGRQKERELKRQRNSRRFCPLCQGEYRKRRNALRRAESSLCASGEAVEE